MLESWTNVTWNHWGIIEKVQKTATVTSEDDLLLGTLNGSGELGGVCLLELLAGLLPLAESSAPKWMAGTYDVCQLSLSDQVLGLGTDELLLQSHQSSALRLLHLGPCDLILDLSTVISAWLDALLSVTDSLQEVPGVIQVVCVKILLLANLTEKNTDLVGEVGDGIIAGLLTPLGKLRCDRDALLACGLVSTDEVVLGLDELEQTSGQIWLGSSAKTGEGEATARALAGLLPLLVGADRERTIPGFSVSILDSSSLGT